MRQTVVVGLLIIVTAMLLIPGTTLGQSVSGNPPSYGYLSGSIQSDISPNARTLDGVVYVSDGEVTYYYSAKNGAFLFYMAPGTYTIWAQHEENGMIYESVRKQIIVTPNTLSQVTPTIILVSLNTPNYNPDPATLPSSDHYNKVNGTVETKDGKPYAGATVTLYERADNGSGYLPKSNYITKTDSKGYFEFNQVEVTSDDNMDVQGKKDIYVQIDYTDSNSQLQSTKSDTRQLYYPNMFIGVSGMEEVARNVQFGDGNGVIYLPMSYGGWVSLTSDPPGASVYVDNQPLMGTDGKQLVTPCTAYIDPDRHNIKLSMDGYVDKIGTIDMVANTQHDPVFMSLDRPVMPSVGIPFIAIIGIVIIGILAIVLITGVALGYILGRKKK